MKKILCMLLLAVIAFAANNLQNRAEAVDRYIGKNFDGTEAYLVTDSIKESMLSHGEYWDGYQYDFKVKSVYSDTREYYIDDYSVVCNMGIPYWIKNGTRSSRSDMVSKSASTAVGRALVDYFYKYSQKRHPNQWKSEKVLRR